MNVDQAIRRLREIANETDFSVEDERLVKQAAEYIRYIDRDEWKDLFGE